MKKLLLSMGMLFGFVALSHAGTPQDSYYNGQAPLSNTTINISTASTAGNANLSMSIAAPSCTVGVSSIPGRNCFTKFLVQLSTTAVLTVLDAGTTIQTIYGQGLGTTGPNTLSVPEDHLAPLCGTAGNAVYFNLQANSGGVTTPQVVNAEGYTVCGGTANKGPLY